MEDILLEAWMLFKRVIRGFVLLVFVRLKVSLNFRKVPMVVLTIILQYRTRET